MSGVAVLADIVQSDATRVAAIALAGASFGVAIPVIREFARITDAYDRLAVKLFGVVHVLIVLFVWLTLAGRFGEDLTWRTPLAVVIFTLKIAVLLLIRQGQMDRNHRGQRPSRRHSDPV